MFFRRQIDEEITLLESNGDPLTFKRGKSSSDPMITIPGFCKDLFAPGACVCRKKVDYIQELIGVSETSPGVYTSIPLCAIVHKSYKVIEGEEFLSDVLFRVSDMGNASPDYMCAKIQYPETFEVRSSSSLRAYLH